jgi:hypothetical protein
MSKLLTIAIPVWNRHAILAKTIDRLVPQLTDECVLRIIDNASEPPIVPPAEADYWRNAHNIGAMGNILRCVESCRTEYLWILGSDDMVKKDSVRCVLDTLHGLSLVHFVNFSSCIFKRQGPVYGERLSQFARDLDSWSNMVFLSACVFRAEMLQKYLRIGHDYAYSMVPHFAMLLKGLHDGATYCLSDRGIIFAN